MWSEEAKRFSLLEKDFSALFPKVEEVPPRDVAGEVKSDKYIFNELSSVIEKLQTQAKFIERSRGDEFCPTRTSPASSELPDFDRLDGKFFQVLINFQKTYFKSTKSMILNTFPKWI